MARGPGLSIDIGEKRYGAAEPVIARFRLDVAPGAVVALVGPSGVGKSTLLRIVAGIDRTYDGSVTIGGLPAIDAPPPGLMFQDARLLPWLTALDNIRMLHTTNTQPEASVWLTRVALADAAESYPAQLSGGMQRRVALARALSVNSRLLLLDEPFVSLDRGLIDDMHRLVAGLIEAEGSTVLLVTHVPEDAAALADRIVLIAGRPARIVADTALDMPRSQRNPVEIARFAAELTRHLETGLK